MDPKSLPIDRYLNLVHWWVVSVLKVDRNTVDQWLTPTTVAAVPADDPVWSAEAEMQAFREAQAGGL